MEDLRRDQLPADTIELVDALAERFRMTRGVWRLELLFKDGVYQTGHRHETLTRSRLVQFDLEEGAAR